MELAGAVNGDIVPTVGGPAIRVERPETGVQWQRTEASRTRLLHCCTAQLQPLLSFFQDGRALLEWLKRGGAPSHVAGLDLHQSNSPGKRRLNLVFGAAALSDRALWEVAVTAPIGPEEHVSQQKNSRWCAP